MSILYDRRQRPAELGDFFYHHKFIFDEKARSEQNMVRAAAALPPNGRLVIKRTNLDQKQRGRAVTMLITLANGGPLPRGSHQKVTRIFGVNRATIKRLWDRADSARASGECKSPEFRSKEVGNTGNLKYPEEHVPKEVQRIPLREQRTTRKLAFSMDTRP
jgi:hypothetical protein